MGTGMAASCKGSGREGFPTALHCAGEELKFAQEAAGERAWLADVTWLPDGVREAGRQVACPCSRVFLLRFRLDVRLDEISALLVWMTTDRCLFPAGL